MTTLIVQLCALCAMSTLMENALCTSRIKGTLHVIWGMLMMKTTLGHLLALGESLSQQRTLQGIFECLIK